ncbi:MAG: TetR family transcriptional regulator [Frankiales bacterium]|nr:TetR family transcriptional regulator [Frankiales bacterium]
MKQQRTRDRHAALVAAAAELLEQDGWSGLTHRRLTALTGVPLSTITYYFAGIDELVLQAAAELARHHLDRARTLVDAVPRRRASAARSAGLVAAVLVGPDPTPKSLQSLYERYLRAGRTPALRELVTSWNADLHALAAEVLERTGRPASRTQLRLLVAALDGLLVTGLAEGRQDPVAYAVRIAAPLVPDVHPNG